MDTILNSIPAAYHAWIWTASGVGLAVAAAMVAHTLLYFLAWRIAHKTDGIVDTSVVTNTRRSARVVFGIIAVQLVLPSLPLGDQSLESLRHAVGIGLIASLTWLVIRSLSVIDDVIMARHPVDVSDNLAARRVHTQTRVLSRSAMVIVAIIGIASLLMTFPRVRQLGASLLASAGVAGLVIGMAARPTLSNLLAGLQLALTQPIRLDDVVIVEGEWGRVEEITATYVVIRIWDQRRLVVPLQYFIDHPFQNWTRRSADILGTVVIHADYTVPLQPVREYLTKVAQSSDLWDGKVCLLQVTNATERTLELRALISAADAGQGWDLRCLVREKLIEFLQREYPQCLPKVRAQAWPDDSGSSTAAIPEIG